LKRSLDEESNARKTGDVLSGKACWQLQAVLDLEGKQRAAVEVRLEDQLKAGLADFEHKIIDLAGALREENADLRRRAQCVGVPIDGVKFTPNHHATHSDLEDKVREICQVLDMEASERRASDDDILQRLGELSLKLEQECGNRELVDTNTRAQIMCWREELTAETASRVEEDAKMRHSFQQTEDFITEKMSKIVNEHEGFNQEINQIKHRINDLSSSIDVELQKRFRDFKIGLERCEKKLGSQVDRDIMVHKHEAATETLTNDWSGDLVAEREARMDETATLRKEIAVLGRKIDDFHLPAASGVRGNVEPGIEDRISPLSSSYTRETIKSISEQLSHESQERRSVGELSRVGHLALVRKRLEEMHHTTRRGY